MLPTRLLSSLPLSVLAMAASADVSSISIPATTKPVFKFGTPTFLGSGCLKDTVAIVTSTDGQSVSVLVSTYNAATSLGAQRDRKSCNLAVPVDVQAGVTLGIFRVDYRGNVFVPSKNGSYAQFDAEYYFAGQRGPTAMQKYTPGTSKDLFISNEIPVAAVVWSPCGASTNFRVNSAITAFKTTPSDPNDVQIAIDSVDTTVQTGFRYGTTSRGRSATSEVFYENDRRQHPPRSSRVLT